ncbi:HNH endonuclease [Priestia sp. OVS21]|nr:HNH endonuclease [Priestia sp. OVS21]
MDQRLLIASHIKPWKDSNDKERLDLNNGLLLCPNHDWLFDKGYISFTDKGEILITETFDNLTNTFMNLNRNMKITLNDNQREYINWHQNNVYNK